MTDSSALHLENRTGYCALCGQDDELCESHILPAFVFKWLRQDSTTGHIRFSESINLRVQDGPKVRLLCKRCDNEIIGRFEKEFSEKLFNPWHASPHFIRYEKYLLKFAVSVSWRVLKYCYGKNPEAQYDKEQIKLLQEAEAVWRNFLLGKLPHPNKFEQHFFVYGNIVSSNEPTLPCNINRFARNSIMLDIVGSSTSLFTFAKLGPMFIFGQIQPSKNTWKGTKIHVNAGSFPSQHVILPKELWPLFVEKANLQSAAFNNMSSKQFRKVQDTIQEDLNRASNSGAFAASMMDADLFGKGAIVRKE